MRAVTAFCFILVLKISSVISLANYERREFNYYNRAQLNEAAENCWESCFQVEDRIDEAFREIYDDVYRAGMEARRIKNIYNVNGTAILIDSSLAKFHNSTLYPDIDFDEEAAVIFQIQVYLGALMATLVEAGTPNNPAFISQFNQDRAWGCSGHQCLDYCQSNSVLLSSLSHFSARNTEDKEEGNIETACSLARMHMGTASCGTNIQNEMAIAILNSDIDSHIRHRHGRKYAKRHYEDNNGFGRDEDQRWEDYEVESPCSSQFRYRMAVGTHAVDRSEMVKFQSRDAQSYYIADNELTLAALENLLQCTQSRCCGALSSVNPVSCQKTEGHFGETFSDFANHEALSTGP